jgi:NTP pyrophosphatase (non-canonical NTP hydrolase)
MTFDDLEQRVISWGIDRGIKDPIAQLRKLSEEFQELSKAVRDNNQLDIIDGIGDMMVVLTMISRITHAGGLKHCYRSAYETIKNRKGKMVNGLFVKEANNEIS